MDIFFFFFIKEIILEYFFFRKKYEMFFNETRLKNFLKKKKLDRVITNYYFNQLLFCKYYCEYLITYWNVKVNMYGGKYWKWLDIYRYPEYRLNIEKNSNVSISGNNSGNNFCYFYKNDPLSLTLIEYK